MPMGYGFGRSSPSYTAADVKGFLASAAVFQLGQRNPLRATDP